MPDAAAIVGQLADEQRRVVLAAVILGARSLDDVVVRTGLAPATAARALGRLVDAGLVVQGSAGGLHLLAEVFRQAAREALTRPVSNEHADAPPEQAKVLRAYVQGGRLVQIPTNRVKRTIVLDWLVQAFEPGRKYSEKMVNLLLGQRHADTAALRRYLVDEGFLDRAGGVYWRSGGTVAPAITPGE